MEQFVADAGCIALWEPCIIMFPFPIVDPSAIDWFLQSKALMSFGTLFFTLAENYIFVEKRMASYVAAVSDLSQTVRKNISSQANS
jgi:hypothetical protein